MTVRYAPDVIERLNERRLELSARVMLGSLSDEEATVLFAHDVSTAMAEPKAPRLKLLK